jgi:hypothetical protein
MQSRERGAVAGVPIACLAHPWCLSAILCLLLNDHVLKGRAPPALTGKLSDFAGLFFFPYLVGLAILLASRAEPSRVRGWAFGLTALWFASAKTTALGHDLTVAIVELLLGAGATVIERDPTDVVALVALVPAWHLWSRCARARGPSHRAEVLAAMLAAGACLATSRSGPRFEDMTSPAVLRVFADGPTLTAIVGPALRLHGEGCALFRRARAGAWVHAGDCACPDDYIAGGHHEVRGASGVRFRLAGEDDAPLGDDPWKEVGFGATATRVIESKDGGATWTTAWEIPRTPQVAASLVPDGHPQPDLRLADLAVSAASGRVAVAFRTEGVLIREPDGAWVRENVGPVAPLADSRTASVALAMIGHFKWSSLAVFWLSLGALAPAAWLATGRRQSKASARLAYGATYLVAAGIILGVSRHLERTVSGPAPLVREVLSILFLLACVLIALSPIVTLYWLPPRRHREAASWSPRLRPSLAVLASLLALALQAALPFAGVSRHFIPFPEALFAAMAFALQAFLAWRDASSRG